MKPQLVTLLCVLGLLASSECFAQSPYGQLVQPQPYISTLPSQNMITNTMLMKQRLFDQRRQAIQDKINEVVNICDKLFYDEEDEYNNVIDALQIFTDRWSKVDLTDNKEYRKIISTLNLLEKKIYQRYKSNHSSNE